MNKGQTQAVTAVLITSITMGAVAATYVWGTPILEKREAEQEVLDTERQMIELKDEIEELSQSGEGSSTEFTLDLPSDGSLELVESSKQSSDDEDREGNYIEAEVSADTTPYASGVWFLLEGNSLQGLSVGEGVYGLEGSDEKGVVAVQATGIEDAAILQYRTEFRNILADTPTGERIELIKLQAEGGTQASGETTLRLTNEGVTENTGDEGVRLESGERLPQDEQVISVNID